MSVETPFVMDSGTREIYPYSEALLKIPGFVPFAGPLPPVDKETGSRVMKDEYIVKAGAESNIDFTPKTLEERINRIAAILHLVPEEETTEAGRASLLGVEKLVGFRITTQERDKAYTKLKEEKKAALAAKAEANASKEQ